MTDTLSHSLAPLTRPVAVSRSRPAPGAPRLDDRDVAPVWMRATGVVLLLAGLGLAAAVLGWPGDAPETAMLVPALVGVVVGVLLLLARTGCTVTDTHVELRFRPLPVRRIARDRIVDVRPVEADASTYGGFGLRVAPGLRALVLTPGPGVEITDDRGRVTFVRTGQAADVVRALR